MFKSLRNDIRVIKDRDPAAKNTLEVLLCYSGLHAIWAYRLAHRFYRHQW
ncbi:MAG: serine O-acetyltransferase, partial [Megasphaera sp.]